MTIVTAAYEFLLRKQLPRSGASADSATFSCVSECCFPSSHDYKPPMCVFTSLIIYCSIKTYRSQNHSLKRFVSTFLLFAFHWAYGGSCPQSRKKTVMPPFYKGRDSYQEVTKTPVISAGAYASGDVVGGLIPFRFRLQARGGRLRGITIFDMAKQEAPLTAYIFNSPPTSIADNGAFALSDADVKKLVTAIDLSGSYTTLPSNSMIQLDIDVPFANSGYANETLYLYLVTGDIVTYGAATAIVARLVVEN